MCYDCYRKRGACICVDASNKRGRKKIYTATPASDNRNKLELFSWNGSGHSLPSSAQPLAVGACGRLSRIHSCRLWCWLLRSMSRTILDVAASSLALNQPVEPLQKVSSQSIAAGLIVKAGVGWTLPPETAGEAKARRKRTRTTERQEQESLLVGSAKAATPRKPAARAKLVKVLGLLGSGHDGEILTASRQAERLRAERGRTWDDLIR